MVKMICDICNDFTLGVKCYKNNDTQKIVCLCRHCILIFKKQHPNVVEV